MLREILGEEMRRLVEGGGVNIEGDLRRGNAEIS